MSGEGTLSYKTGLVAYRGQFSNDLFINLKVDTAPQPKNKQSQVSSFFSLLGFNGIIYWILEVIQLN